MILTTLMPRPLWWLGVKLDHAANSGERDLDCCD
jgi:hypothetical protein